MKQDKVLYNVYVVNQCTDEEFNVTRYCSFVCQTMAVSKKQAENNARFICNPEKSDMYEYIADEYAGSTWERWYHAELAALDHGEYKNENNYSRAPEWNREKQLSLFDLVKEDK